MLFRSGVPGDHWERMIVMRKNLGVQPALFPMPVLMVAAYDSNGKTNVMNAAWGQISAMDKVALFIDEEHRTTKNIRETKAFTVSITAVEPLTLTSCTLLLSYHYAGRACNV